MPSFWSRNDIKSMEIYTGLGYVPSLAAHRAVILSPDGHDGFER